MAILPIISKVLERVIFCQIVEDFDQNQLFHPNHHGFRAGHSTCTALLQMYDSWIEALEQGEMTGVCLLDMSAAFDVVSHNLLVDKLTLYGFTNTARSWMESYLEGRSQCVYVDGSFSSTLRVNTGVPQGSILGPLCYVIFTNELPEVIHSGETHHNQDHQYHMHCSTCGGICCFADDSTLSIDALTEKLSSSYKQVSEYMTSSELKLNDDKTHLLLMTTAQKRKKLFQEPQIIASNDIIQVSRSEKLLGITIHENMKWAEYILHDEKSLTTQLSLRLNGLKKISKAASFKSRLTIANGIFMSKLIYCIPLWSGCEIYLLEILQKIQNRAARVVTRLSWDTPIKKLLKQCGWLSVSQLSVYHSLVQMYKILQNKSPGYLHQKITNQGKFPYPTSSANKNLIRMGPEFKTDRSITNNSFRWRTSKLWNQLPVQTREIPKLSKFKQKLKIWVREKIGT